MSTTTPLSASGSTDRISARPPRATLWGVFLLSLSSLLLELALTRLFSVVLFYHFAFLAISVALLGLGTGGLATSLRRLRYQRQGGGAPAALGQGFPSRQCAWAAMSMVVALLVVLHSAVSLEITLTNFLRLSLIYLTAATPFFFMGSALATVLADYREHVHQVYFADLGGAAAACLALVALMNSVGGPSTVLVAAGVAMLASLSLATGTEAKAAWRWGAVAALVLVAFLDIQGRWFDITYAKGMRRENIEFKKWNSFSRIEVHGGAYKDILIDSDADTAIVGAGVHEAEGNPQLWSNYMRYSAALAYIAHPGAKALIIGPGGGSDVMRALLGGSHDVTAVEINPIIVDDIMLGRYLAWSHGLYRRPEVHPVIGEGRSYVRRSRQKFDVIQATMVDTWASTAAGALALSESNLYTVQAFREYLRHLTPSGMVSMTRWEFKQPREALRVVSLAMVALRELGVRRPERHLVLVSDGPLNNFGVTVTTLVSRSRFSAPELAHLQAFVAAHPPLQFQYYPGSTMHNAYAALLASGDPAVFTRSYPYNVTASTDNRPFFFYTLKTAAALGLAEARGRHAMDWKTNLALFLLLSLLLLSALAVGLFLVLPLLIAGVRFAPGTSVNLLYFVALGLGYILIEVAFIQRYVLFLGHPTYALTVVVFLMLAASSLGSWSGRRWRLGSATLWAMVGIIGFVLLYSWALGPIFRMLMGLPLLAKFAVSLVLLSPMGFLMGMPFPAGLDWLSRKLSKLADAGQSESQAIPAGTIEWAWSLNAGASVLGSVMAIFIAIHAGMTAALLTGGACYLAALLLSLRIRPDEPLTVRG